ncbi:phage recombination protein Bet [Tissierella pigra]|nr:phage recombination protein Bet [Tissierella pigra]MBU5424976.1 phage recombination protein Bet [Tissierella pigra]
MSNIVESTNQLQSFGYNQEQVNLIKNTVAKGATNDELQMFMYLANQYSLDPFKKEIWFMKYSGQTNIMTSRDGYLKYAQLNEDFEGLMSFVVKEGDVFEIDASEYKVTHKFGANRGQILGAWARCDRKGKKPFIAYVEFAEYNKNSNIWKSYPSAMIQKVAEVFVLKRAFGINGLVTREEIDAEEQGVEITEEVAEGKPQTISKPQQKRIFEIAKGNQDIVKEVLEDFKLAGTADITRDSYNEFCSKVEELANFDEVVEVVEEVEEVPFSEIEEEELPWKEED